LSELEIKAKMKNVPQKLVNDLVPIDKAVDMKKQYEYERNNRNKFQKSFMAPVPAPIPIPDVHENWRLHFINEYKRLCETSPFTDPAFIGQNFNSYFINLPDAKAWLEYLQVQLGFYFFMYPIWLL